MAKVPDHDVRALASIAERMLKDLGDHDAAKRIQGEVNRLRSAAEALDNVRRKRNPLDTQDAHALRVGKLARKFDQEVTAMINRIADHYRVAMADIDRRIAEKVDLRPNGFADEIREVFRSLDRNTKVELLGQLVKENRGPELAAIVRAPSILSGLTDAERANFENSIIGMHAREEVTERAAIEDVMGAAHTASVTAGNIARRFSDPRELARIEEAQAQAKDAGDDFDQALQ